YLRGAGMVLVDLLRQDRNPGIRDSTNLSTAQNAKIAQRWESLGCRPYRDNVYLLSPASQDLEEQRGALRRNLAELGGSWRAGAS
ncbi:hypothetical protein ACFVN4_28375, partial [Streptomyces rochei]|uniref:hypothetical protein n=1 Tax=Streptomyces rochei TaxID=1928 RepID=UPI0036A124F8